MIILKVTHVHNYQSSRPRNKIYSLLYHKWARGFGLTSPSAKTRPWRRLDLSKLCRRSANHSIPSRCVGIIIEIRFLQPVYWQASCWRYVFMALNDYNDLYRRCSTFIASFLPFPLGESRLQTTDTNFTTLKKNRDSIFITTMPYLDTGSKNAFKWVPTSLVLFSDSWSSTQCFRIIFRFSIFVKVDLWLSQS